MDFKRYMNEIENHPGYYDDTDICMVLESNNPIKVYLDDMRGAPPGWILVRWPNEVIELLKKGNVSEISLDHDLGDDRRGTGYDVLTWIEKEVVLRDFVPPIINIHTANTSARRKMESAKRSIYKRAGK